MQLELPLKNILQTSLITVPTFIPISIRKNLQEIILSADNERLKELEFLIRKDELDVVSVLDQLNVPSTINTIAFLKNSILSQCLPFENAKNILIHLANNTLLDYDKVLGSKGGEILDLKKCFNVDIPEKVIIDLLNFIADDHSFTAVGRGEFFFNLLLPETKISRESGGDLMISGRHVEIKGKWSKLASQKTHSSPITVGKDIIEILHKYRPNSKLRSITMSSLKDYYPSIFNNKTSYGFFIKTIFDKLMCHNTDERKSEFVFDCISDDLNVDFEKLKFNQAKSEYEYYTSQENVDWIFFIDPVTARMVPIRSIDDFYKAYKLMDIRMDYSFNSEQGKALRWKII